MKIALFLFAAALAAAAAPAPAPLAKVRAWPVYDARTAGETDFGDLCRMARLPCGAVASKGENLAAPSGPISGQTVGAILDRILAAHPGYAAETRDGVLSVRRPGSACAAALERPARKARYPVQSARVASWMVLRAAGWPGLANAGLASLTGDAEDARYLRVQVMIHGGARVRQTLDAIARGDGRMLWLAEDDGKSCSGFRFLDWRAPQPVETSSVLVSVSGPDAPPRP